MHWVFRLYGFQHSSHYLTAFTELRKHQRACCSCVMRILIHKLVYFGPFSLTINE
jgi:hypothetical protein